MASRYYVITGGTMVHVAPHFSFCAPAFGSVGEQIGKELKRLFRTPDQKKWDEKRKRNAEIRDHLGPDDHIVLDYGPNSTDFPPEPADQIAVRILRTTMANQGPPNVEVKKLYKAAGIVKLETNEDLEKLVDHLILQPETKGIILACAVCDWIPDELSVEEVRREGDAEISNMVGPDRIDFGKREPRLQTRPTPGWERHVDLRLVAADKLISRIRKVRKDIFLVGFKATTGMSEQEQYITGLGLLKGASCNLVLANDVHNHVNMVITPEEAKYHVTKDRKKAIKGLCEMIVLRSQLHFTRSTVIEGDPISWDSDEIPANLRKVVDHCIARGAYKPFKGKTVGHFATRGPKDGIIYTSRRKSDFNRLPEDGLLRIDTVGEDQVIAHGAKPSVGGQSQRIIFDKHPHVDCIVHFHCPMKEPEKPRWSSPGVREQRPFECGSHECGQNTSAGIRNVAGTHQHGIQAVMLEEHGPNICFPKDADPEMVIDFIEEWFDLDAKTGGPVSLEAPA